MEVVVKDWWLYQGEGNRADRRRRLADLPAPPWRDFNGTPDPGYTPPDCRGSAWERTVERGEGYVPEELESDIVNTALYLRRPLLITGKPGVGKSTLADSIAVNLELGPVLRWPITSRTALRDGLYLYDAIGRLQEANLDHLRPRGARTAANSAPQSAADVPSDAVPGTAPVRGDLLTGNPTPPAAADAIGRYLRLGPLGTALLPQDRPRVLLIDEIDKSDIDLPGDLLTLFEDGGFEIPELARLAQDKQSVSIATDDAPDALVEIESGRVQCRHFPVVVLTSNGERDFPPAFLRRCVRLHLEPPGPEKLARIIRQRLDVDVTQPDKDEYRQLMQEFIDRSADGDLATDQLLNAIQLRMSRAWAGAEDRDRFLSTVMQHLTGPLA
ncbi:AAA family ATPase [Streptomyces rubiginosohelvolus]|uniref:AAA family ATPase n=1 Tax=Streptomyces rubiginosohelvolus TaxID=67362 RepID=UPI0036659BC0